MLLVQANVQSVLTLNRDLRDPTGVFTQMSYTDMFGTSGGRIVVYCPLCKRVNHILRNWSGELWNLECWSCRQPLGEVPTQVLARRDDYGVERGYALKYPDQTVGFIWNSAKNTIRLSVDFGGAKCLP